jgi:hypothetical protein
MQRIEHNALLEQLNATALLKVRIELVQDDRRDQQVHVDRLQKVLAIGINNSQGSKPATNVHRERARAEVRGARVVGRRRLRGREHAVRDRSDRRDATRGRRGRGRPLLGQDPRPSGRRSAAWCSTCALGCNSAPRPRSTPASIRRPSCCSPSRSRSRPTICRRSESRSWSRSRGVSGVRLSKPDARARASIVQDRSAGRVGWGGRSPSGGREKPGRRPWDRANRRRGLALRRPGAATLAALLAERRRVARRSAEDHEIVEVVVRGAYAAPVVVVDLQPGAGLPSLLRRPAALLAAATGSFEGGRAGATPRRGRPRRPAALLARLAPEHAGVGSAARATVDGVLGAAAPVRQALYARARRSTTHAPCSPGK